MDPRYHLLASERLRAGAMTAAELDHWRACRLAEVLRHVVAGSPFYARHLAGVDLAAVTPRTLPLLPFTTKADLQRGGHAVLSGPVADALVYYETTGTTGPATPCPRAAIDVLTSNAAVEWSWRRLFEHEFGERMPVVALMGPSELYAFGDTFGDVAQRIGAPHVKLWPESPRVGFAKALRLLRELSVEVVVCAPALCLNLAKAARHHGYDVRRDLSVRLFAVLGEICTEQLASNVSSVWGASVVPTLYGSQEALAIATGCPNRRLHISPLNYLVEVLDPASGVVRDPDSGARTGELCLTMLIDGIKPLVRYRTGDLVTLRRDDCGCGVPGDLVDVHGRVGDLVRIGSRSLHPAELEALVLAGLRGCLGYQVTIDEGDAVTVRLDLGGGAGRRAGDGAGHGASHGAGDEAGVCRTVERRLSAALGVAVRVELDPQLDPITNTGAFVSWKAARIVDRRAPVDGVLLAARRAARAHLVTS